MKEKNPTFDSIKKEYLRIPEENQITDASKFHNVAKSMQYTSQKQLNLQEIILKDILAAQQSDLALPDFRLRLEGFITQHIKLNNEFSLLYQSLLSDSQLGEKLSNDELPNTQIQEASLNSDLFGAPKQENEEIKELQTDDKSIKKLENSKLKNTESD